MDTMIDKLKNDDKKDLLEEIEDLKDEVRELKYALDESENERAREPDFDSYKTSLGIIHVSNQSGNLQLQQELDQFFELLQDKYK